jgi:hypothetical protein
VQSDRDGVIIVSDTPVIGKLADALGRLAALAVVGLVLGFGVAGAQPVPSAAEQQFTAATQEYAWMHRRLEAIVGPTEIGSDMAKIDRAVQALAAAIAAERSHARAGELFTPAIAVEMRNRIAWSLAAHDLSPQDVREAEAVEGVDPSLITLRVNGRFPWIYSSAMFPCVLQVLPPLPPELQYRIVGDTLLLIDVHASLIVDLLPSVLSPATER